MANIKLNTRFGKLDVDPSRIITFPRGIPGFDNCTQWTLFHEIDAKGKTVSGVVSHLQSIDDEGVTITVTEPSLFGFNYELVLTDSEVAELKLEDPNDILVMVTLAIKNVVPINEGPVPLADMSTNISAPILINIKSRIGMQKILVGKESKVEFLPIVVA